MTPQPGVEVLELLGGTSSGVVVTDLDANILWTYANPGSGRSTTIQGVKLLPNGDFLMGIGPNSSNCSAHRRFRAWTITEIREVNLAGDTVREITLGDLNAALGERYLR